MRVVGGAGEDASYPRVSSLRDAGEDASSPASLQPVGRVFSRVETKVVL